MSINHSDETIMNLPQLIESISQATDYFQREALRQINRPQQVFVSKYLLNLPDEMQLKAFIEGEQNKLF